MGILKKKSMVKGQSMSELGRMLIVFGVVLAVVGVVLLLAVLAVGAVGNGAQRWLRLGAFNFQPSEVLKITVPMMIAYYLADRPLPPQTSRVVIAGLLVLVPIVNLLGFCLIISAPKVFECGNVLFCLLKI